nr:MAG TPA: hypothetical protein [Caudoviricetes sp.]
MTFHEERFYQNTVYCSNYGANVSNISDDYLLMEVKNV